MPCPLDPTIQLHGIVPSACAVFKSSLAPIKLVFNVAGAGYAIRAHTELLILTALTQIRTALRRRRNECLAALGYTSAPQCRSRAGSGSEGKAELETSGRSFADGSAMVPPGAGDRVLLPTCANNMSRDGMIPWAGAWQCYHIY